MTGVNADDPLVAAFAVIRDLEPTAAEVGGVLKRVRRHKRGLLRSPRLAISLAVLVVVGGGATAAAVNPFSALTGIYVRAGDRNAKALGTGQAIAMGAYNDVSVGAKLTRDIPFAPGYESWRAGTIAFQTRLFGGSPHPGHAYITSSALRWQVAEAAVCSWLNYYVASKAAGNTAASKVAAAQITAAPGWPAVTGLSYPSGLGPVVAAVGAGDPKLVQALIDAGDLGNCVVYGPFPPVGMSQSERTRTVATAQQRGQREIATDPVAHRLGITDTP
jgi:hypothetical protein